MSVWKTHPAWTTAELAGFARGSDIYTVGVVGDRAKAESVFTGFESITAFKLDSESDKGRYTYQITSGADYDISEEIFDLAVSNGFKLTELRREVARLEDIFRTLTTKEVG